MKQFVGYLIRKAAGKKVSPTIKSVKPTKLSISKSLEKTKDDEYRKRYTALDKAEGKLKTGKQMMKEGQKERKKLVDTRRAFKFPNLKSFHAVQPGNPNKLAVKPTPDKKFKKGKELEKKADGGRIGRRFGSPKPKTNVQKIKETFAPRNKNLNPVDPKTQKGLSKLPREVRNKMGYMKSGGRAGFMGGGASETTREKEKFQLDKNISKVKEKMKGPRLTKTQAGILPTGTKSGGTRPKPDSHLDPNHPINIRKKNFKKEMRKDMK